MVQTVCYCSPFIPAEWIAAHGLQPRRLFPASRPGAFGGGSEGLCPYAQAFAIDAIESGAPIIAATSCDQMRRMGQALGQRCSTPVFVFNLPATWSTPTSRAIYRAELQRLGRFLVSCGGTAATPLTLVAAARRLDTARAEVLEQPELLASRHFAEQMASPSEDNSSAVRVALLGGPLLREHVELFSLLERLGARVVLDATETGERTLPARIDFTRFEADPLEELTRAYFDHIPDVFRRPNDRLYGWLKAEIAARKVQAALLLRCVWCDLWQAEVPRLKEALALPLIELDAAGPEGLGPRTLNRVQALLEIFT